MSSSIENTHLLFKNISEYDLVDEDVFKKIVLKNEPAILRNCSLGNCMKRWDLNYLDERLKDETIVIHDSENSDLDFIEKNFNYRQCNFTEFSRILRDKDSLSRVYLRSTNKNPRAKKPARIECDFPSISEDLEPPKFIPFKSDDPLYHSSVLRIASANVQIWTHFDLYDNVLCQVLGTKRAILLPPEDIKYLYIKGDKSSVNNFDDPKECLKSFPLIAKATLYKCFLRPTETLFIPALWWHNIRTVPDDNDGGREKPNYSIGFNIFWRDQKLDSTSIYAESDVYGNKNLKPVDAAFANLDKAVYHLEKLPENYKYFFKYMLFERLKCKLFPNDNKLK